MTDEPDWKSQLGQDRFAWLTLDRKCGGTFADIGAGHPEEISNTFTLERSYGWSGILCDIEHAPALLSRSGRNIVVADAMQADWSDLFGRISQDGWIDFLSLDIEPPELTARLLISLPFDDFRFRVACVEHDAYRNGDARRDMVRAFMRWRGYEMVSEVGMDIGGKPHHIEDWWVHRDAGIIDRAKMVLAAEGAP